MEKRRQMAYWLGVCLLIASAIAQHITFSSQLRTLRHEYDSQGVQMKQLQRKENALQDDNQRLSEKDHQLSEQNQHLSQENQQLSQENAKLKQELDQTTKKLQQLESLSTAHPWLPFKATYYDAYEQSTGKRPGDPGFGVTASGRHVQAGVTIAVDPKVIPLGSVVELKFPDGHTEVRRADDVGGAIKGRHIDIYVPLANRSYGVTKVMLRILKSGH
ncbi:3D domain-containing protein [Alicyclobacillus shizuokensis]|uniref:3D domain-containing protein n=1 Tax=Alicyclobacillus shizuokensis TaxID=392014 RepID=UPI00082DFCBC|nr:3D domain-containing protein [Alicyclobacillus shizuokensis]